MGNRKNSKRKSPDVVVTDRDTGIYRNETCQPLTDTGAAWIRDHNDRGIAELLDEYQAKVANWLNATIGVGAWGFSLDGSVGAEIRVTTAIDSPRLKRLKPQVAHAVEQAVWGLVMIDMVRRGLAAGDVNYAQSS